MTNEACFHGQIFLVLRKYLKYHSFCLPLQLMKLIPQEGHQKTKESLRVQREKLSWPKTNSYDVKVTY